MNDSRIAVSKLATAIEWPSLIAQVASDRCDLDALLREEWRHKVAIRDDYCLTGSYKEQQLTIDGPAYAALKDLRPDPDEPDLAAIALTAFHGVLGAYGHGSCTVVAYLDATARHGLQVGRVLPTVVDHVLQSGLTCAGAVQALGRALKQYVAVASGPELLGRGLFDAILVLTDRDGRLTAQPTAPLVAVVRDDEAGGGLHWTVAYAQELFEDKVVEGLLEVLREVLNQLASRPTDLVGEVEFISEEQKRQLDAWNATDGEFPDEVRLEELFEVAVQRTPEFEALVCGETRLTYLELNARSNRLAHWLIAAGVRPEELVALYLDKSNLVIVATLGIWKAGAAYVPIDPNYPADRVLFTLRDTKAMRIITNRHHAARLRQLLGPGREDVRVIELEAVLETQEAAAVPTENLRLTLGSEQVAYVTYTSGTTGVPKGVAKYHRNVVNSITDLSDRYNMRRPGEERVALFASLVFEPFMRQTLIALINSQTLVVVPDDIRLDPNRLPKFLALNGITYLNGTGSVLQHFDLRGCPALNKVLLVGEELTGAGLRRLREKFTGRIINEYSFTETAFVTAIKMFDPGVADRADRSIGRPLRNVKCYVLTRNLKRVPVGAVGELYIGGRGIAQGYLNRDGLTAERFLPNPFQTEEDKRKGHNSRIYKTGDLARMLPDGQIEFLGRSDFQLKLNGVRVEPGEIEARVAEYPGVRQCVVVPREGPGGEGDRRLVGYFVADESCRATEAELIAFLEARLIRVMVPARMVRLDRFPVNVNGKVDRRALPDVGPVGSAETGVGDGEDLLGILREIWAAVLGIPAHTIDPSDDFFRLGGQSINCTRLIMRVWEQLRLVMTVEDVYRLKTLGGLADQLKRQQVEPPGLPDGQDVADLPADDGPIALPANGLQQGLLYHALKAEHGDDAYVMQSVYRYRCSVHRELMEQAWRAAHRKYPALRLRFEWRDEAIQIINPEGEPLDWRFVDLSGVTDAEAQDAWIREIQQRDRAEPYTPVDGQLFRMYLIKQRDDLFVLLFSCHHLILDGWSLPALIDDVHRMYIRLARGETIALAADTAYVAAQRYWKDHRDDHLGYWTTQAARTTDRGDLGGLLNERSRYKVSLDSYDRVVDHRTKTLSLGADRTTTIKAGCAAHRVTLHSALQFVWHQVLHAVGGGRTTVVGTVVSGRNLPVDGIEHSVGLFINTLPLVVDHDNQAERTVATEIGDIQDAVNRMTSRSTVELGRLPSGELKRRLFDTLLVLENYPRLLTEEEAREHKALLRCERAYDSDKVDYPLAVVAREEDGKLTITLWYAGELFDDDAIDTLLDTTLTLLDQVAEDMSRPVRDLEYVSPAGLARFDKWNRTNAPFPEDQTLHGRFEEAAARWPDAVAVVSGDARVTYAQLNERANRLAHHLREAAGVRPGQLVGLVLDKSERLVVAVLGVWKAGAGYVPVDPAAPDDRVRFMLDDTGARLVLAGGLHADRVRALAGPDREVLDVDRLDVAGRPADNPAGRAGPDDLAYAIYTSGTTGRPKAVLVEHQGVVSFRDDVAPRYFGPPGGLDQAVLFLSNYVFDFSVEQLALSVLSGHTLVIPPAAQVPDDEFYTYANAHRLTYLSGTPTQVTRFDLSRLRHLQLVLVAGEAFQPHHFEKIRREFTGPLLNAYGTTETTVYNTVERFEPDEPYRNTLGEPISNSRVYVLDDGQHPLPPGAVGELCVAGECVTAGYLNREDLTRERFVPNPFLSEDDRRSGRFAVLYRTGDVVRWRPDWGLEFLGRNDQQVKVNGLRVEPGEVEEVLATYPGIRQCAVVARTGGRDPAGRRLVGYYTTDGRSDLVEEDVRAYLAARLMAGMVPTRLIRVDGPLPLTVNGKLDTAALPEVDLSADQVGYAPPRNRLEARLCQIWGDLLPVGEAGIDDDFFRCGGDSIAALQLAGRVQRELGHQVSVRHVFDFPTVRRFAGGMLATAPRGPRAAEPDPLTGACPLLPIQGWFFAKQLGSPAHWNQYFAVRTPALDVVRLRAAIDRLVDHHDAFRLRFRVPSGGGPVEQFYAAGRPETVLHALDVRGMAAEELRARLEGWQGGFDLEHGPLHCAAYLYGFEDGTARVWLSMHHLIVDVVSWRILAQDLEILYHGGDLGLRGTSYRQWALAVQSYPASADEERLWDEIAAGVAVEAEAALPVPIDGRYREWIELGEGETRALLTECHQAYGTHVNDLLLTAVGLALRAVTGEATNYVTVESHGREAFPGAPDVRDAVGWFTTMYPVAVEAGDNLGQSIARTKVIRGRVPHNGIGYGGRRGAYGARDPLPQASFNYLGQFEAAGTAGREAGGWRLDPALCGLSRAAGDEHANASAIDVTMSCVGGRLTAEVDARLTPATTRLFAAELKARLEAIIAHTLDVSRRGGARAATRGIRDDDMFEPYVVVNEGVDGPTLFFLPPGEGGAESYLNNLARRLPGLRLVLFNNVHLHRPMASFEELASYYLGQARRLQPSGPYHLLGWSFGGVLALEMALQLARDEETVPNLLLIDPYFNARKAAADIGLPDADLVLDPINSRYAPGETDLARLRAGAGNVVLFKAVRAGGDAGDADRQRLFEYYARSLFNNLDTLLPPASVTLVPMADETHFTWVRNEALVASMGSEIRTRVLGLPEADLVQSGSGCSAEAGAFPSNILSRWGVSLRTE